MKKHLKGKEWNELLSLGISKNKIRVIGHLGIEDKINSVKKIDANKKKEIKNYININSEYKIILLTLELFSENFDEKLEFGVVLKVLEALEFIEHNNIEFIVKLHPSQSRKDFCHFLDKYDLMKRVIVCPDTITDYEVVSVSDIVIGLNSVILMIPLILGIHTISLDFNMINDPKRKNTIPYLRKYLVNNSIELSEVISKNLSQNNGDKIPFQTGSVKKAWRGIKELLYD